MTWTDRYRASEEQGALEGVDREDRDRSPREEAQAELSAKAVAYREAVRSAEARGEAPDLAADNEPGAAPHDVGSEGSESSPAAEASGLSAEQQAELLNPKTYTPREVRYDVPEAVIVQITDPALVSAAAAAAEAKGDAKWSIRWKRHLADLNRRREQAADPSYREAMARINAASESFRTRMQRQVHPNAPRGILGEQQAVVSERAVAKAYERAGISDRQELVDALERAKATDSHLAINQAQHNLDAFDADLAKARDVTTVDVVDRTSAQQSIAEKMAAYSARRTELSP